MHTFSNSTLFLCFFSILIIGCQSNNTNNLEPSGITDITDEIFTKTTSDCTEYADKYASLVTDIQRNARFQGSVTIVTFLEDCTISVNGIPNHDFNDESANFANQVDDINRTFTITRTPEIVWANCAKSAIFWCGNVERSGSGYAFSRMLPTKRRASR